MKSKTTFFIIPGFLQQTTNANYTWLVKYLKKETDYNIVLVPMVWKYRVMSDYADQFRQVYNKKKSERNYVLGFSYGAVVAFITANDLQPDRVLLCSLSPDFREDLPGTPKWAQLVIGKRRMKDSKKRSAKEYAKNLHVPSVVFYGTIEANLFPRLKKRCEETVRLAKKSRLVVVPNTPHAIHYPEYQKAIKKEIEKLG